MSHVIRFVDGGEDQVWPEVRGYHLEGLDQFAHDDSFMGARYESDSEAVEFHSVDFMSSKALDGRGGSYEIFAVGHVTKGEFSSLREIPAVLSRASKLAAALQKSMLAPFKGRPNWTFIDYQLDVYMRFDGAPDSDYTLSVKFEYPDEVIFGKKTKKALIEFDLDELRLKRQAMSYGSKGDIQKVLRAAEQLFEKWSNERN